MHSSDEVRHGWCFAMANKVTAQVPKVTCRLSARVGDGPTHLLWSVVRRPSVEGGPASAAVWRRD